MSAPRTSFRTNCRFYSRRLRAFALIRSRHSPRLNTQAFMKHSNKPLLCHSGIDRIPALVDVVFRSKRMVLSLRPNCLSTCTITCFNGSQPFAIGVCVKNISLLTKTLIAKINPCVVHLSVAAIFSIPRLPEIFSPNN